MITKVISIETRIKEQARAIGFSLCGISNVELMSNETKALRESIDKGYNAEMTYLSKNTDVRENANLLVENAKSVICLALNYYPGEIDFYDSYKISKYALGEDYHPILKEKLWELLEFIKIIIPEAQGRCFVDSAPIFEKSYAQRSGIGKIGKHTLLITPEYGTYIFLGEIVLDVSLIPDMNSNIDPCGNCTKCLDACPTGALCEPYALDARKCISYLTIEHKVDIEEPVKSMLGNSIFGCDICQDACPHNKHAKTTENSAFLPSNSILSLTKKDWQEMDDEKFNLIFKNSPLKRAKLSKLKRNMNL